MLESHEEGFRVERMARRVDGEGLLWREGRSRTEDGGLLLGVSYSVEWWEGSRWRAYRVMVLGRLDAQCSLFAVENPS